MRFAAPRSDSPSLRKPRRQSRYGLPSDSEEDESSDEASISSVSSSSKSFCYESEEEPSASSSQRTKRVARSVSDQHKLEDMIAAIRLRVSHQDAYEEWEQQTRKDAFLSARQEQAAKISIRRQGLASSQTKGVDLATKLHRDQVEEVARMQAVLKNMQQQEETRWRETWNRNYQIIQARTEQAIKQEEAKVLAQVEEERKRKEEEQKKKETAELMARLQEEKRQQEEAQNQAQEDERQRKLAEERQEKERVRELEKTRGELDKAEAEQRKKLGITAGVEDWTTARRILLMIKEHMQTVKGDKDTKSIWSAARRAITPKIGQLTNDPQTIARVSKQLQETVLPTPQFPKSIYLAVLSSLAKAILLQAETEVTAEKRSAIPLAQVTTNLLGTVGDFPAVFWGKLCQRAGGWPCPAVIPEKDVDGTPLDAKARQKVLGYREHENAADYMSRVSGLMRVYFHIMSAQTNVPLKPHYRMHRFWAYLARLLSEPHLLGTHVAAEIIYVALDVNGARALEIWGQQWVKLLVILYQGCTTGLHGKAGSLLGGKSPEGIAARVRVQLEIEKLMGAGKSSQPPPNVNYDGSRERTNQSF